MKNLVPIKVKIGLKLNGHAEYPNFNAISVLGGADWSKYVDKEGLGWHYDKKSTHQDDTIDSPQGTQYGVLVVPKEFAKEALERFPSEVTRLSEIELQDFYDNKAHAHEADEKIDEEALKPFEMKEKMRVILTPEEETKKAKALDPNDDTPGITKNKRKKWADLKVKSGVEIDEIEFEPKVIDEVEPTVISTP